MTNNNNTVNQNVETIKRLYAMFEATQKAVAKGMTLESVLTQVPDEFKTLISGMYKSISEE